MKSNAHSLRRERPIAQSNCRHSRPMRYPGRSSCDTTPSELGVIDLVTQHDKAAHQEFSGHRRFGFGLIPTMEQALVKTFQVRVLASRRLASLAQEKAEQPRAGFADAAHAVRLGR